MADTQLDRIENKLDNLIAGLTNKQSPFARTDDAPPRPQPVEGFERVFGVKPKPGTPGYYEWGKQIPLTTKVYDDIPDEYEKGAMELASRTGVKAVFVEHGGELKVALNVKPEPWFTSPANFIGSNIEGVIRAVKGNQAP